MAWKKYRGPLIGGLLWDPCIFFRPQILLDFEIWPSQIYLCLFYRYPLVQELSLESYCSRGGSICKQQTQSHLFLTSPLPGMSFLKPFRSTSWGPQSSFVFLSKENHKKPHGKMKYIFFFSFFFILGIENTQKLENYFS